MRPLKLSLLAMALCTTPAVAQQKAPVPTTGPDIIVTGTSLKAAQAALQICLAQRCAPDKDIDATLAVAETQFVAGDYQAARATMLKSLGRNKRFAKSYPIPVSDLLRATSRVSAHLGEQDAYFVGALDVVGVLKAGLPDSDVRVLTAQIDLGDAFAKTGRLVNAMQIYHKVVKRARELGLMQVEGAALLHTASVNAAIFDVRSDQAYYDALRACNALIGRTEPAIQPFVRAATLLKAKLAVKRGDVGAIDALIASYRATGAAATQPVLLYAPKIEQPRLSGRETAGGGTMNRETSETFDGQWVDIGFEISPAGTVISTQILRRSPKLVDYWVKPVLIAIAGRRYAPLLHDTPNTFRVERYSYTAAWTSLTGTHTRVRSPFPQIEMLDLSRDVQKKDTGTPPS